MSAAPGAAADAFASQLFLRVNGASYGGWTAVRVTRGIERFPSDFDITASDPFPDVDTPQVIAKPGDPCVIALGADTVLTGYVDRVLPSISPEGHMLRITGRGKCEDLADCAALIPGAQTYGTSVTDVARAIVQPFLGISVSSLSGDGIGQFFQVNVNLGETPYEILERIARYEGLLLYEDQYGNLVFSTVGTTRHASGIAEGVNMQSASAQFSMDGRYDRYLAAFMSADRFSDIGTGGNVIQIVYDKSVPRYRPRVIVSEQAQNGASLALLRANWELARRRGRSQAVTAVVDSWRDSAGLLWQPNMLAPVSVPSCYITDQTWCISEVTYSLEPAAGTTAQLTLMPPEAFTPEPAEIQTIALQIAQNIREGGDGNTKTTGPT